MMRTYSLCVLGLPPKKSGSESMWRNPREATRISALRKAARDAIQGQGPLTTEITLVLKMHLTHNNRWLGDLDTFIAGVCDGLQPMAGNTVPDAALAGEDCREAIGFLDDAFVIRIEAEKCITEGEQDSYEVEIRGE